MKNLVLSGLLVMALLGAGVAQSAPGNNQQAPLRRLAQFRMLRLAEMKKRLNLTPEQVQRIKQITRSQRLESFDGGTTAQSEREALLSAIFSETPNQAEIHKRMMALQQAQAEQLNRFVATTGEINKVLTPEQRTEFQKMLSEGAQRRTAARAKIRERLAEPSGAAAAK